MLILQQWATSPPGDLHPLTPRCRLHISRSWLCLLVACSFICVWCLVAYLARWLFLLVACHFMCASSCCLSHTLTVPACCLCVFLVAYLISWLCLLVACLFICVCLLFAYLTRWLCLAVECPLISVCLVAHLKRWLCLLFFSFLFSYAACVCSLSLLLLVLDCSFHTPSATCFACCETVLAFDRAAYSFQVFILSSKIWFYVPVLVRY